MNSKRILLVEDNPDDELLITRTLAQQRKMCQVTVVRDGVEALHYLFGTGPYSDRDPAALPNLVLLDLKLPKVNGLEVLKKMRENAPTRMVPVVVFSSSDEPKDIQQSYQLGANSYLRKPVDYRQFSDAVSQISWYWLEQNLVPASFAHFTSACC